MIDDETFFEFLAAELREDGSQDDAEDEGDDEL